MTYTLPVAVQRQTSNLIELFIMERSDETLAITPATYPEADFAKMAAYRMRWLRGGRYFAVTTWPDGHATDSRCPRHPLDLRTARRRTLGEMNADERAAAIKRAAGRFQAELTAATPHIERVLEDLGMPPADVNAALAASREQAAHEDETRIWWAVTNTATSETGHLTIDPAALTPDCPNRLVSELHDSPPEQEA